MATPTQIMEITHFTAAEVPVKFQSDRTILSTNLEASSFHEILR